MSDFRQPHKTVIEMIERVSNHEGLALVVWYVSATAFSENHDAIAGALLAKARFLGWGATVVNATKGLMEQKREAEERAQQRRRVEKQLVLDDLHE